MNNTEVIFENIEQRILKEIESAHYAIFVSVAWFTNKKLFNALLEKAKNNCYVSIIIQLDEINSQCRIDYTQINIGRSECFMISKDAELLHEKFCVIDFKKVITGSYNWTYKASYNSENILILNDPSIATQYISRFEQQKAKFNDFDIKQGITTAPNSINTIDTHGHTTSTQQSKTTVSYTTINCTNCNFKINSTNKFCPFCGTLQDEYKQNYSGLIVEVTCKTCLYKQESALLSAGKTRFCTFCGSTKLEWNLCRSKIK